MENNDFDNLFANKFNQLPGGTYSEAQWSSLSSRLDTHESRRNRWLLPVLLPLFALLGAANVFWWYQWREVVRNNQNHESVTTYVQTDTVVKTMVVHRYDTIYQNVTVVRRQYPGNRVFSEHQENPTQPHSGISNGLPIPNPAIQGNTNSLQPEEFSEIKTTVVTGATNMPEPAAIAEPERSNTPEQAETRAETANNTNLEKATTAQPDSTFEKMQTTAPTKTAKTPLFYFARPRLGLTTGWSTPLSEHLREGYLLGFGLGTDVEIARNIRLGVSLDYWTGKLESEETEGLVGVDVPNPGNNYELKHWETDQLAAMTYALHLRYQFPLKSSWSPWIGMGAQATTRLPFDIAFEYENEVDDEEIKLTEQAETSTFFQGMLLLAGVEGKISPRFSLGADGFWLFPLAEESGLLNNQLGLKARLYYHF